MTILNPIVRDLAQQNLLAPRFEQGLFGTLAYRNCSEKQMVPNGAGETVTKTRTGYLVPDLTPLNPLTLNGLDNGLTPTNYRSEQYTLQLKSWSQTIDVDMIGNASLVVDLFLQNTIALGKVAAQTRDYLSRNALLDAYMSGNSFVRVALGAPSQTLQIDDVRGFETVLVADPLNGAVLIPVPVSPQNPLPITINGNPYNVTNVARDNINVSKARFANPNGIGPGAGGVSGTITLDSAVSTTDGALNAPVLSAYRARISRPGNKLTTAALNSNDKLTQFDLQDAVSQMRDNAVPAHADGLYHVYLDNYSMNQLINDTSFQLLYRGTTVHNDVYQQSYISDGLGLKFIATTQAPVQKQNFDSGITIHRPIICGADVLVEGTSMTQEAYLLQLGTDNISHIEKVNDMMFIVRPALDRQSRQVSQTFVWIGGYVAPTDATATNAIIGTASDAYYKRAIIIEHA